MNNKSVVDSLVGSDLVLRQGLSLVRHILLLAQNFEVVVFNNVLRESNKCVDFLAKLDLPRTDDGIWMDIFPVLHLDLQLLESQERM